MATLRDILRKIGAVKKTRQITRAMNMVAAARLRGAQAKMEGFDPYAAKFSEVLGNLASRIEPDIHPLLVKKEDISSLALLHFTSDRGLCGSFNTNLINMGEKWINDQKGKGVDCRLTTVGKKGRDYFGKRGFDIIDSYINVYGIIDMSFIGQMAKGFIDRYMADEIDEVYMIYSRFISMARQEPTLVKLIPVEPPKSEEGQGESSPAEYLCEPDPEELLIELLPKHIGVQIVNAFLQNETSEHAARMAAMDNASKNCNELVENLTLVYNKARQAAITAELMDIVGGAEALR
ncbi:MAG: ATP synthase F1 subunit gamma [Deltaproteobacteria bacterium]|nr:ATP synthase F1 subunit gamma [Deltaproteobacteria bacterium]MBW1736638.1 ATP synthase F1 subunit gamma [Deltaproteobacteria bacterium]MBW1909432.1 ATP synthase F1 subunit gamma [Deltaproteobacteria bacterium]MBW2032727.1 ATP synthase F1 subunit gamma [Deltaproteobacteria bacterium]MBW2113548.1 ATP synthase F1 subunit gamma [Deltaproteobacteria bacterium]